MSFRPLRDSLLLGATHSVAAWSAYAVIEFFIVSGVLRLGRPATATWDAWHWRLSGNLLAAYLVTGLLVGLLSGVVVFLLSSFSPRMRTRPVFRQVASLTVCLAFSVNLAIQDGLPWAWKLVAACALFLGAIITFSIASDRWSKLTRTLGNPWIAAGLLIAAGQSVFQLREILVGTFIVWTANVITLGIAIGALAAVGIGARVPARSPSGRGIIWIAAPPALLIALAAGCLVLSRIGTSNSIPSGALAANSSRPNVIWIVMDTTRADHLSAFGYYRDTTPNLRKLARDAALYPQAISPSDMTLSSHAAMFTGMYPSWHGAYCLPPDQLAGRPLTDRFPTAAAILTNKGYTTFAAVANPYFGPRSGLRRGFQTFRQPLPVYVLPNWYMLRTGMRRLLNLWGNTLDFDRQVSPAEVVTNTFFDLARQPQIARPPFFAFLNYMDAHFPYTPPAPFADRFPGRANWMFVYDLLGIERDVRAKGIPVPASYTDHVISQYDGGIAYVDAQIGRIVTWLQDQKLYDNTMIVVTSDHGESFGAKGLFFHGNSVYQNLIRVGLLVKYPHNAHQGVIETPVSTIDILPTVLTAAGYPVPQGLQGMNLLDPGATAAGRLIFSESFPCQYPARPEWHRAVISWPNKVVISSKGTVESYDLSKDNAEERNLNASMKETTLRLASHLSGWMKTFPRDAMAQQTMDAETLRSLKSLGYLGGP
jgi:arylsulfatase A-like enzyme